VSSRAPRWAPIVPAENKQDKLGTSVTLPMQSAISSVGFFPVGTCLLGPRRGYLQKGLRSSSQSKLSKSQIRWLME